jgi:hypothetical protein
MDVAVADILNFVLVDTEGINYDAELHIPTIEALGVQVRGG